MTLRHSCSQDAHIAEQPNHETGTELQLRHVVVAAKILPTVSHVVSVLLPFAVGAQAVAALASQLWQQVLLR